MIIKESEIEKNLKKIQKSFLPDYDAALFYGERCRLTVELIHEFTKKANETEDANEQDYLYCLAALNTNALLIITMIQFLHEDYIDVVEIIDSTLRDFVDRQNTNIIPDQFGSLEELLNASDPLYETDIRILYDNYLKAISTLKQTDDNFSANHLKVRIYLFELGLKVISSLITFKTQESFFLFEKIIYLKVIIVEDTNTDDGFEVPERIRPVSQTLQDIER